MVHWVFKGKKKDSEILKACVAPKRLPEYGRQERGGVVEVVRDSISDFGPFVLDKILKDLIVPSRPTKKRVHLGHERESRKERTKRQVDKMPIVKVGDET